MTHSRSRMLYCAAMGALAASSAATDSVRADPLPGRDVVKFSQRPMIHTTLPNNQGTVTDYFGHDEYSTLNRQTPGTTLFQGEAMADDFADNFSSPVVHVKWWGSYMGVDQGAIVPPVPAFLIAFESDVPQSPNNTFSHPGTPLQYEVVTPGAISLQSGTFTETLIPGSNPLEPVYEYNAELKTPFAQQKDTVYWLKIAALVDLNTANPTRWGWHNRDYTITDPYASPVPIPGERDQRIELGDPGYPSPVWHFQDDSVNAITQANIVGGPAGPQIQSLVQSSYAPQNYINDVDGPGPLPGQHGGIGMYSKDLAFELYTVPEPAALPMLVIGGYMLLRRRNRRCA